MKKTWAFLGLLLISVAAYAALDWEIPNNVMKFGDGTNGTTKSLEMKMGLGVSNPVLSSLDGTEMKVNIPFRTESEYLLGDGSAKDLPIKFDINGTADIPEIKYDNTIGELVFKKKAGANFKKFGTGSGGGGGENFNNGFGDDDNPNAEDGTTGWSNVGGTFAVTTVDPIEGEQSFTFTPSAQADYVDSSALDFDRDIFRGNSCEARVEYIGGDDNLSLKVLDGNGDVLVEKSLPTHNIFGQESAFFVCPTAAAIGGDANKGILRYRIENVGASAAPIIKWDKSYMGTLRGLTETVLPDTITLNVDTLSGSCVITEINIDNSNNTITCTRNSVGNFSIDYSGLNLTSAPTITDGCEKDDCEFSDGTFPSTTLVNYLMKGNGTQIDGAMSITIQKTGADAKQRVQVYTSYPKVSENRNLLTANFSCTSSSSITSDHPEFTITNISGGICTIGWTGSGGLGLTVAPKIVISDISGATSRVKVEHYGVGTADMFVRCREITGGGACSSYSGTIYLTKQGNDYKTPSVNPLVVGQIQTNFGGILNSCGFHIDTSTGTPVVEEDYGNCISSLVDNGAGDTTVNFNSGYFSADRICTANNSGGTPVAINFNEGNNDPNQIRLACHRISTEAAIECRANVMCFGPR